MPNDATRATAEGLPQPSLYRLLSTYWDRYEALDQAMRLTDAAEAGTKEREQAERAQFERGDEVNAAGIAICAFLPRWSVDAHIKAHFVDTLADNNAGCLPREETEALLSSLPFVYARREGGEV